MAIAVGEDVATARGECGTVSARLILGHRRVAA
jgi:hypothetical protein